MAKDDKLYAFIIAHTSRSRSNIRRVCIHRRWLKVAPALAALVLCAALYGVYRESAHWRTERENERLRVENELQQQRLKQLKDRVDAIDAATRRLAEISGVSEEKVVGGRGAGGPRLEMDEAGVAAVEARAAQLEEQLRAYESALREKARIPSLWPVAGETTDGFGGRRDPFGDGSFEFHAGQDIRAERGAPVFAAAAGTVSFAGTQNGYGQMVEIEHGGGLATRYAHLSQIETTPGQRIARGQLIGRVGSTGRSTGPHLHYEVRVGGEAVNPRAYLPGAGGGAEGRQR